MQKQQNIEPDYKYVECTDFTPGLNTLDDPIDIDKGASPFILNMDVVRKGKLLARFGYEEVCEIPDVVGRGIQYYYRTYDDNSAIDNFADKGGLYANTYTPPVAISEAATDKLTFTPSSVAKSLIFRIAVWVRVKGTGDLTLTLHDAANTVLRSFTIANANVIVGFNFFSIPYQWTAGALHFHVTSDVADTTLRSNVANDLSTASYEEIYSTKGNYLILHTSDGNAYYITATNSTPTLIGSWGTDANMPVRGTTFDNYSVFSDGSVGNFIKQWNGTTLSNLASLALKANIFSVFQKRLFTAGDSDAPSRVNYSDSDSTGNITSNFINITVGDGWDVTSMIPNNDSLQVYKTDTINGINFSFDNSYNLTVPQQQPIMNSQGGVWATDSAQAVYGYTYYMSNKGFETYGPSPERVVADRPLPLSLEIEPTFKQINMQYANNIKSAFFDNKYMCAVPLGGARIVNSVFVYNENIKRRFGRDNWTMYDGIPAAGFCKFRNQLQIDELHFISCTDGKVYKFNNTFSDAGFGYNKIWTSKTFKFGERTHYKYIDFEGVMTLNEVITIAVYTDTEVASDTITKANLISSGITGAYVGDSFVGNSYVGGGFTGSATPLYKFKKRFYLPQNVDEGYSMYFQLSSSLDSAGWGMNRYVLSYYQLPEEPSYGFTN